MHGLYANITLFYIKDLSILDFGINEASLSGSEDTESPCNAEDRGLIPGSGKSPGEGNGYQLQYSCLENLMDRGAWQLQSMGSQRVRHY